MLIFKLCLILKCQHYTLIAESFFIAFSDIAYPGGIMSRLKISDLSFCEIEVASNLVRGGISVSSSVGSWSTSTSSDHSSGYYVNYSFDKNTGEYTVEISAGVDGAVAGGISGALSDGTTYSSSYATALA